MFFRLKAEEEERRRQEEAEEDAISLLDNALKVKWACQYVNRESQNKQKNLLTCCMIYGNSRVFEILIAAVM